VKLRIKGNSLRLRVTRSELARLTAGECVAETIQLSPEPTAKLRYALVSSAETNDVSLRYQAGEIRVIVSPEQMRVWSDEGQVGIYTTIDFGKAGSLEIAVEKDFACLDHSDEDNKDTFANPHMGKVC
jgi:hypothetical protein